jgi:alanyl-tRNA synthetase
VLGGGGGGKPELAQGGGTNIDKLSEAIAAAAALV